MSAAETKAPKGQLMIYTGNGKGKTTAALGMVFRALGRGHKVVVMQFIKGKWKTGERQMAEKLTAQFPLEFVVSGEGFTWDSDDLSRDAAAAQKGWARVETWLQDETVQLVVLDELTYALNYGFLPLEGVREALKARHPGQHVVITGRNAPPELQADAQLITEMQATRHPYEQGHKAVAGVDF